MKIIFKKNTLVLLFFISLILQLKAQENKNNYQLIWSDEFNNEGLLDTTKWRVESGFVRNQEAQWYQKENAFCKNGNLIITGNKERKPNPNYIAGSNNWKTKREFINYTSASVVMKKEHAFMYGKIEVRAKIETQTGLWPAIWTLGINGEWPSNGEVDIMEYYNDEIHANFAIASKERYKAIWKSEAKNMSEFGGSDWANQYHIWKMEWDENSMKIFVDDLLMNEINLNNTLNKSDGLNPFRQPHYLLLNLALGGNRGGSLENTVLPSQYLIDYVRIYQKK
jgi:beta-glucanase (GH16 family)